MMDRWYKKKQDLMMFWNRGTFILKLTVFSIVAWSPVASIHSMNLNGLICIELLKAEPTESSAKTLSQIRATLDADMADVPRALEKLEINPSNLVVIDRLGTPGASGRVFLVRRGHRFFALKIFSDPYLRRFHGTQPTEFHLRETDQAILIQKALGDAGVAPKVYGIMPRETLVPWMSTQQDRLGTLRAGKLGLLMELTSSKGLKGEESIQEVSPTVYRQLIGDAYHIERVLVALGIGANDLDAVITVEGRLKLIDTSWYNRKLWGFSGVRALLKQLIEKKVVPVEN